MDSADLAPTWEALRWRISRLHGRMDAMLARMERVEGVPRPVASDSEISDLSARIEALTARMDQLQAAA